MNRTHRLAGALVLAVAGLAAAKSAEAATPFPDKNLDAAVRAVLRVDDKADLNDEALNKVFVLEAPSKGIENLTGLEKCKNLALLRLNKNKITDVKPLAGLINLQSLDLSANQITDAGPLSGLTNLQYLELSENKVTDVAPLKPLTKLSALYLGSNAITDIAPLETLTGLASLHLEKNQITNIGALGKITRISTLDISDNPIVDLSPLKTSTDLRLFIAERCKVADLQPLVDWLKADSEGQKRVAPFLRLYVSGNPLNDAAKGPQTEALKGFGARFEMSQG